MYSDFVIKNALIADGSGKLAFRGSVAVGNSKIILVSEKEINTTNPANTIDAKGFVLSPGFIDTHGHSDISLLAAPEAPGKISQGITTEISGNCGLSVFPVTDKNREHLRAIYRQYGIRIDWNGVIDYAEKLDKICPSINLSSLCGHNTLRAAVMGYDELKSDSKQLLEMKRLLRDSLEEGAAGFSTGFLYVPGKFADKKEIAGLLGEFATFAKPYTTHLRSEGDYLVEAVEETIGILSEARCKKLHISHLKTAGEENWRKIDDVLLRISQAREKGVGLTADRYPYVESMTQLSAYLPSPYNKMDDIKLDKHLQNPENFTKFLETLKSLPAAHWESLRLISASADFAEKGFGKTFADFAKETGMNPAEICAEILRRDAAGATAACAGMSEDNLKRIIKSDFVACGSDESARTLDYSLGRSHPRGFGSMPRFINYVSPELGMEEAVRKITSLPAKIFNLKDRGMIAPGFAADLVLFDPDKLSDSANFAFPHRISKGILKVWVNGTLTFGDGELTGKRAGKYIRT